MNGSSTNASASSSLPISHQPASRLLPTPDPSKWPRPRSIIGGHRDHVGHIAWNLDGKKLASGAVGDKGLRIWDVSSSGDNLDPRHSHLLSSPHTTAISGLQFNPSYEHELVSTSGKSSGQIAFWDDRLSTSKPVTLLQPTSAAYRITHHPEGRVLATSDFKEQVTFYDYRMLEVEKPLVETSMDVDGAAGESGAAKELESKPEWKESETKYANDVSGTPPVVYDISFSPSGADFLVCTGQGQVTVSSWTEILAGSSPSTGWHNFRAQSGSCDVMAFDPDGRYMATAGNDAIINLWQTDDWIGIHSFDDPIGETKHLAFSDDGEMLAVAGDESLVYIYSTVGQELIHKIATEGRPSSLAWSPKQNVLGYTSPRSMAFSLVSCYGT